jgi:hypothetical protein
MVRNLRRPMMMPEARRSSILVAVRATVDAYVLRAHAHADDEEGDKLWDLLNTAYSAVRAGDVDALRVILHGAGHLCVIPKSVDSFHGTDPYTVGHLATWCAYDARSRETLPILELILSDLSHQRCEHAMTRAVRFVLHILGYWEKNDGDAAHAHAVDIMVRYSLLHCVRSGNIPDAAETYDTAMMDAVYFRSEYLMRALLRTLPELQLPPDKVIAIHQDALLTLVGSHKPGSDLSIAMPLLSVLEAHLDHDGLVRVMNGCMHQASCWGMARIVQQFLRRGASPDGDSPKDASGDDDAAESTTVEGEEASPLFQACKNGFSRTAAVLVEHGARLSEREHHLLTHDTRNVEPDQLVVIIYNDTSAKAHERRMKRVLRVLRRVEANNDGRENQT